MQVNEADIKIQRDLIASGDLDLSERRKAFRAVAGRDTKLSDYQLIQACALTDDDDDELFASNVKHIEDDIAAQSAR